MRIFDAGFSAIDIINGVAVYTKTVAETNDDGEEVTRTTFSTMPLTEEEEEDDG